MKLKPDTYYLFRCEIEKCNFFFVSATELGNLYCPRCQGDTGQNLGKIEFSTDIDELREKLNQGEEE